MNHKKIGVVIDPHGLRGELKVLLYSSETSWHKGFESLYLKDGQAFKILSLRLNKTHWIVKLKDVEDRIQAESFKSKEVFCKADLFMTSEGEEPYLSELFGWTLLLNQKPIGIIESVMETAAHFLLVVNTEQGRFEIPYVENYILTCERTTRCLDMDFPEGLLSEEFAF